MVDSKQQLRTLWAARGWLALAAVVATLVCYVASNARDPVYKSSALAQILPRSQATGVSLGTDQLLQVTNFYAEIAETNSVAAAAQKEGNYSAPLPVDVFAQPDLLVLEFEGRAKTPKLAAQYANDYARAFEKQVAAQQQEQRDQTLAEPRKRAEEVRNQLKAAVPNSAEALALTTELQSIQDRLTEESLTPPDRLRLIQTALPPSDASSPKPARDAILAFIFALLGGSALVLLRSAIVDRFRSVEEAAMEVKLPVLAELPRAPADQLEALEAFRKLRAQLEFSLAGSVERPDTPGTRRRSVRDQRKVILVTSPESGAGKSYVTTNLAKVLAADGHKVIAVDGDLRRPTLHQQFEVNPEPGVGEAIHAGRGDEWELDVQATNLSHAAQQRGGALDVFAAGRLSGETAERLSSEPMAQLLDALHAEYDFVIVDSPPVLAIVDAVILSRYADAVVLVVDAGRSRRRDVHRAVQTLRAVDAPILGLVFNRSKIRDTEYGYYGRLPSNVREAELSG